LEVSQYNQLISECNEIIKISDRCNNEQCREQGKQIKSLLDQLTSLTDNTNQQLMFLNKAVMVLKEPGFKSPEAESENRVYINLEQQAIHFSVFPRSGNGQWGIIYNLPQFLNQLTQTIIPIEKQNLDFHWQYLKKAGNYSLSRLIIHPEISESHRHSRHTCPPGPWCFIRSHLAS